MSDQREPYPEPNSGLATVTNLADLVVENGNLEVGLW